MRFTETEHGISEGQRDAFQQSSVPGGVKEIFSTSLRYEVGLNLKLGNFSWEAGNAEELSYMKSNFSHWQKSKDVLLLDQDVLVLVDWESQYYFGLAGVGTSLVHGEASDQSTFHVV